MELHIDTSDNKQLIIRLMNGSETVVEIIEKEQTKADQVLVKIKEACNQAGISIKDIKHVTVHKGPGSFTGVRVGVSIANALAFTLGISVNSNRYTEIETPTY